MKNTAAVLHGVNDLRVEEWPLPASIAPGHVRVSMQAVGICGSDVHYLQHGKIGDFVLTQPMVIGHESSGIVDAVGEGVHSLKPGDKVALEPGVPCWHCKASREGRYNLDPNIQFFATPPVHGSLASYVDHPAELCYRLPASVSLEEGAMCEPLSVGVHACRRAQVQPGKTVVVLGAGPIGLVVMMCAQAFGADRVIITDIRQSNLQFVEAHYKGVRTLHTKPEYSSSEVVKLLQQVCGEDVEGHDAATATARGGVDVEPPATSDQASAGAEVAVTPSAAGAAPGARAAAAAAAEPAAAEAGLQSPDIVIDCVGVQQTLETAIKVVAPGGKVVLVGMGAEELKVPAQLLTCKEMDLLGSFRYCNTYPLCLNLIASKRVDVTPMITHRFGFTAQGVTQGFDAAARSAVTGAIKVMFNLKETEAKE